MGAGKTEVANNLRKKFCEVLEADIIAKDLMHSQSDIILDIKNIFGRTSYHPDGSLNAQHISTIVFQDPNKLRQLNQIVHPAVEHAIIEIFKSKETAKQRYCGVEAALIFEAKMEHLFRHIIYVDAPRDIRVERIRKRSPELDPQQIGRRMKAQIDPGKAKDLADFVIINDQSLEVLEKRTDLIMNIIMHMTGTP